MGCKGSKPAEAPKSETASSTLLAKPEEPKGEVPATEASDPEIPPKEVAANAPVEKAEEQTTKEPAAQGSVLETTTKDRAASATVKKADESPKEAPADAVTAGVEESAAPQEAPKPIVDATVTKAEEAKSKEATTEEGSATGLPVQVRNDETATSPEEVPAATEKMVAGKVAEADAASKEEATESTVSVATVDVAVAGKQGGCFSYCTATEAQNEIVVQN